MLLYFYMTKKIFRYQGLILYDLIGALILPLIFYFVVFNFLIYYMKSNNIKEISDWIVYFIFFIGIIPTFFVLKNFYSGVVIDYQSKLITAPKLLFFRQKIKFDDIEGYTIKDKKYTRIRGSGTDLPRAKFYKYFLIFKIKYSKEKKIIFRDQKTRFIFTKIIDSIIKARVR